jgi:hypothetical protein
MQTFRLLNDPRQPRPPINSRNSIFLIKIRDRIQANGRLFRCAM